MIYTRFSLMLTYYIELLLKWASNIYVTKSTIINNCVLKNVLSKNTKQFIQFWYIKFLINLTSRTSCIINDLLKMFCKVYKQRTLPKMKRNIQEKPSNITKIVIPISLWNKISPLNHLAMFTINKRFLCLVIVYVFGFKFLK